MDGRHEARIGRECTLICIENGARWTFDNMHKADSFLGYMHGYITGKRAKGIDILINRNDNKEYKVVFGDVKRLYPVTKGESKLKTIQEGSFHYTSQLCWNCRKASGGPNGCNWSKRFKPVEGWEAIPTVVKNSLGDGKKDMASYQIISCPEYDPEKKKG